MASNKYTQQTPKAGSSIKTVMAERVYMHAANTAYSDPAARLDGGDPAGWTDLGVVAGSKVQMTYTKETRYVETGIERVRRGAYVTSKVAQAQFTLEQFDMDLIESLTGQTATAVGAIGAQIHIGQDDLVEKALLFVGTNKVDNKEHHTYCKKAAMIFSIEEADDARVARVTADLYSFVPSGETVEAFWTLYILT